MSSSTDSPANGLPGGSPGKDTKRRSFMRMPTSMLSKEKEKAEDEEPDFSLDLLDESQMIRLKRAFSIFDKDDSGSISSDEMLQVFRLLGSNPSNGEFGNMLDAIDTNRDGCVDFMEFARVWWKREQENIEADFDAEMELAFKVFDTDGSGMITRDELREKLTTLGEKMTDDEVEALLAEADTDGSGSISLEEFKNLPCWRQ